MCKIDTRLLTRFVSGVSLCKRVYHRRRNRAVYDASGVVDVEKLRPMGRLGGDAYASVKKIFSLPPPDPDNPSGTGS